MPSFSALSFAVVVTPPFPSKPLHLRRLCASAQRRERHSSPDPPLPPPRVPVLAAPWMRAPLLVPREDALHLPGKKSKPEKPDASKDVGLTAKIRGGRSRYAMRRIIRTVERLREVDPEAANEEEELARDSEQEWRGPRAPWVRPRRLHVFRRQKKLREVTQAEVKLDRELLERLRVKARGMRTWAKAKKCGVTDEVVEEIRRTWKWSELAMVRIVEPLSKNMDRAREIVETKTGGLVVWTKKDKLVIYRGTRLPLEAVCGPVTEDHMINSPSAALSQNHDYMTSSAGDFNGISIFNKDGESPPSSILSEINNVTEPVSGTLYMRETDRLLDGLGPRFVDWWMRKPLPVDADLLTEVPDFESPRRICVPHTRATLTDDELTYLRKIARPLPIHFALGRNTKLEGLAAAIIKLWERSLIAKIAVKQGILNTNYKIMSSKLKSLTGGTLILCNKFYIILYRGKDFLPPRVADSVFEREIELRDLQVEEEQARQTVTEIVGANDDKECDASIVGTFKEFQDIQKNLSLHQNKSFEMRVKMEAEKENLEKELRKQKRQLSIMRLKQGKSQEIISKINNSWGPAQLSDKELLTEEERQKFRKIGLKMDEVLMLGRRGIYDGVLGSIYLHWRHRELVKVITMQKESFKVNHTAKILESESGGVLISIEKYKTGHAIIIFRGKNYRPPSKIFPENLPTKREALQKSIEVQRRGSLKFFARGRQESIHALERKINYLERKMKNLVTEQPEKFDIHQTEIHEEFGARTIYLPEKADIHQTEIHET